MIFSYNTLQSLFLKKLPDPKKLAENLIQHSFEVEGVEKKEDDWALDIDVLPNRAHDCFSHLGIAREIGAILNLKLGKEAVWKLKEDKKLKASSFIKVAVKNRSACPRYIARVVSGVKVGPSPKWLKERLEICGLQSINNIVDIANYVMLEVGQPLHAFDLKKLEGGKIVVRNAKRGEKIATLDNQEFKLDENDLVIADAVNPVAIAGIKGGKNPEIDKGTEDIVIESANFNYLKIRTTSRKLNLRTDASVRFEHDISPCLAEIAINRAAFLVNRIAGGKTASGLVDVYPKKALPKKVLLDLEYINRLLGLKIPEKDVKNILHHLNFKILKKSSAGMLVEVPTFRIDVSFQEDLIEEVGRIYGYDRIKEEFPVSVLIPPKRNLDIFWENSAKDILKGFGFNESWNYSFISENDRSKFGLQGNVSVKNPLSEEHKYLRSSLAPNLFKNVEENIKRTGDIRLFELGKVFFDPSREARYLSAIIGKSDFYRMKGVVEELLNKMGISDVEYVDYPSKSAGIRANDERIGFIDVKGGNTYFEIDFDKLSRLASEENEYRPISKYPAAVRDIAVLVSKRTKVADILNVINASGGPIVRDVDLFDIYEGEGLSEGKKSLAFHVVYQSEEKTLSSLEVEEIQKKIISALEDNPEWQVRKK